MGINARAGMLAQHFHQRRLDIHRSVPAFRFYGDLLPAPNAPPDVNAARRQTESSREAQNTSPHRRPVAAIVASRRVQSNL